MKWFSSFLVLVFVSLTFAQSTSTESGIIRFNKTPAKVEKLEIVITEPAIAADNNVTYDETIITIKGLVSGGKGISKVTINSVPAKILSETEFVDNIHLLDGVNNIMIRAVDLNGKLAEKQFTITTPIDLEGPKVTIIEPRMTRGLNVVHQADIIKVRGKAEDPSGIYEVTVDGRPATLLPNGEFMIDKALAEGENRISIKATDMKFNITEETFTVEKENSAVPEEKRVALIIGNSDYVDAPLRNPANDARDMAASLRKLGFEVIEEIDVRTQNDMKRAVRDFGKKIRDGGVGLFYYAGHGIQLNGVNYLIPTQANIENEADVEYETLQVNMVLDQMEYARNRMNIVVLDACRNNPFARSFRSSSKGLSTITKSPSGTFIAYATSPNSVASDGEGENGLYTEELLDQIEVPGLTIEQVFKNVLANVKDRTDGAQIPWTTSSIDGEFFFKK